MLIVDVYNVLHVTGVLPPHLAGLDVAGLAALLAGSRFARQKTLLICDGPAPDDGPADSAVRAWGEERLRVVYAGAGRDADALIEELVHRFGGQRTITLVSSDRRLRRAANTWKCKHLSAEDFLDRLALDHERHARGRALPKRPAFATDLPLPPAVVRLWMQEMGIDPKHPDHPPRADAEPPRLTTPIAPPESPRSKRKAASPPPAPAWPGSLNSEDLDMERWLKASSSPPPRPKPEPRRKKR